MIHLANFQINSIDIISFVVWMNYNSGVRGASIFYYKIIIKIIKIKYI